MSIVRIGMAENKKYADGYAAIFGTKKKAAKKAAAAPAKKADPKKPAKKK